MCKISVVMPLYNAERFLEETLKSVLQQTYRDFELICVNDASTDDTMVILKRFQDKDKRIMIMSNGDRSGAAISRNRGMRAAKGKYITFLDGDDIFDEEMLRLAYETIEEHEADLVCYKTLGVSSEHIYEKRHVQWSDRFISKFATIPFAVKEHALMEYYIWTDVPCDKLYRKKFIDDNQLKFQDLPSSNDVYFSNMAYFLADKIIMLNDRRVMVYLREHNTSTRIFNDRNPMCAYWAMEKIGKELIERGRFSDEYQYYYFRVYFILQAETKMNKKRERREQFCKFLQEEGIDNLINLSKDLGLEIDKEIYGLLLNFKNLDYRTEWYQRETRFKIYLYRNAKAVEDRIHSYHSQNLRTALWGAGENGRIFLDFLQEKELKVAEVLDKDQNKQGKEMNGYTIKNPNEALDEVQIILVAGVCMYSSVLEEVRGRNIEVISILEMIGLE